MTIVNQILDAVSDTDELSEYIDKPTPIGQLIKKINELLPDGEERLSGTSTGSDLKKKVESFDVSMQVRLLGDFSRAAGDIATPATFSEDELDERREARKFKYWMRRAMVWTGIIVVLSIVASIIGAVLMLAKLSGKVDTSVINGMMNAALEIFKVIVSSYNR